MVPGHVLVRQVRTFDDAITFTVLGGMYDKETDLGVCFAVGLCLSPSHLFALDGPLILAQVPKPRPPIGEIAPRGSDHHITGTVTRGACGMGFAQANAQLVAREFWYALDPRSMSLTRPQDNSGRLEQLAIRNQVLQQGRVLGSVRLTSDNTNFDIRWNEVIIQNRVPWMENVQIVRTRQAIHVYRVIEVRFEGTGSAFAAQVIPLVSFFGSETTKHVGQLVVSCLES